VLANAQLADELLRHREVDADRIQLLQGDEHHTG